MSILFQADADLDQRIVKAVRRAEPAIDFQTAAEIGLKRVPDSEVLQRAAQQGRILISHDRSTMPDHLRARLRDGQSSPGVFIVRRGAPLQPVVEALILIWAASAPDEWVDQVRYLPSLARHVFLR